ncbi:MAG TPA: DNA polymerase domain-containing protein [Clostridia bacterium]|nr:DNA polymerase domain-containing protein [Clostridia bacterium]
MDSLILSIDSHEVKISNPRKILWPERKISKMDYIHYLMQIEGYLLPYARDRFLMMWCYPDGIYNKRIVRKALPTHAPDYVERASYKDKQWILLNNRATLAWVGNLASLELHATFARHYQLDYPTELVFDLDPMEQNNFTGVLEVALDLKNVLDSLSLFSLAKTSGATGIQVHVPITPKYTFKQVRQISRFIAEYMVNKYPQKITIDRTIERRGKKLYFDYLQLWKMKTIPLPYSVRARQEGTVAIPVTWEEIKAGFSPLDFTMDTVSQRLRDMGDLFGPLTREKNRYEEKLDDILCFIEKRVPKVH